MQYCTVGRTGVQGGSRRWLVTELDNSLRRLGVDHVDLYQIHRWDPRTSDQETLSALTDLQRAGKIRYFGTSTLMSQRFDTAITCNRAKLDAVEQLAKVVLGFVTAHPASTLPHRKNLIRRPPCSTRHCAVADRSSRQSPGGQ